MWIDDVAPYETIQSLWGNTVRDRLVQTFDTAAERNTHAADMPEGTLCYVIPERALYVRRAAAPNGFGTVAQPWQNYALQYQLDPGFPNAANVHEARFRRVHAFAVEVQVTFVVTANYGSGINNLLWSLPVPSLVLGESVIGNGEALDAQKYVIGPVKRHTSDPLWAWIIDPATRQPYKPVQGAPIVRVQMRYEVADG